MRLRRERRGNLRRNAVKRDALCGVRAEEIFEVLNPLRRRQRTDSAPLLKTADVVGREGHPSLFPQGPVNGQRAAITPFSECVEEAVCECVIALADVANHAGNRGEEDEEIEGYAARSEIEIDRAKDLRRDDGLHFFPRL